MCGMETCDFIVLGTSCWIDVYVFTELAERDLRGTFLKIFVN